MLDLVFLLTVLSIFDPPSIPPLALGGDLRGGRGGANFAANLGLMLPYLGVGGGGGVRGGGEGYGEGEGGGEGEGEGEDGGLG